MGLQKMCLELRLSECLQMFRIGVEECDFADMVQIYHKGDTSDPS